MVTGPDTENLSRSELVEKARELGVERPERMTRVELRDEMIRRTVAEEDQEEARGLFGVARSMLASVVETGLNLPDAAKVIRGDSSIQIPAGNQTPVATVTLAEIYAAQGHQTRALRMLDEVLREEPEHQEALRVRRELLGEKEPEPAPAAVPIEKEPGATPDYVPGGFVDTTGEEIRTGNPPVVQEEPVLDPNPAQEEAAPTVEEEPVASAAEDEALAAGEEPSDDEPPRSRVMPLVDVAEVSESGSAVVSAVRAVPEPLSEPLKADSAPQTVALAPCLILKQSKKSLSLYWELPGSALEHCGVDSDEGQATVMLVAFTPSGAAPVRDEYTLELPSPEEQDPRGAGVKKLKELAEPSVVRAALGWESDEGFLPLCVGRSVEEWGASGESEELLARATAAFAKL